MGQPILRRLLRDCRPELGRLGVAAASVALLGLSQLALTWLVKSWIDGPLATGDRHALVVLLVEAGIVIGIGAASVFAARAAIASANQRLVASLRSQAMARWLSVAPADMSALASGDVMARLLNDAGQLALFLGSVVRRLCREAVVAAGALVMLFVLDWRMAGAACLVVPVGAWALTSIGRAIRRGGTAAQHALGALAAVANEQVQGLAAIKISGAEPEAASRFADAAARARDAAVRAERLQGALAGAMFLVTGAAMMVLAWHGTFRLRAHGMPDATLVAFLLYAGQVVEPMRRLSDAHALLQGTLASAARVYELVDWPHVEDTTPVRPTEVEHVSGGLRLQRVSVTFAGRGAVLDGVSVSIAPCEQVAVVGASGAGKTTLARVLVRLVEISGGHAWLDDREVGEWPVADLRAVVCLVPQDVFLFSGSLADNVRLGRRDLPVADAEAALRRTGLGPLLDALPRGAHTPLAEMGRELSGGERQRLALARAVVRDPRVLVLDEATSAVDGETETSVLAGLAPWLEARTVICIAHRLSTVARFPRVVVLDQGRLVADGPLGEVRARVPAFRRLFAGQDAPLPVAAHGVE